jgi:hypothetical protein
MRHARPHAESESGLLGPSRPSPASRDNKRPSRFSVTPSLRATSGASSRTSLDGSTTEDVASSLSRRTVCSAEQTRRTSPLPLSSSACSPISSQHASAATHAPHLHPSQIPHPHLHRQTSLQERRRPGSQRRYPMSQPPPPPCVPLSGSPEPFLARRTNTDGP